MSAGEARGRGENTARGERSMVSGTDQSVAQKQQQRQDVQPPAFVATIAKNRRERLGLHLDEYKGHKLARASLWFANEDEPDRLLPAKGGLSIRVEKLAELIAGLQRLEAEARRVGWLP